MNDEIKRNNIKDTYFTEENYPFKVKPKFSTLGKIIEIKPFFIGSKIIFLPVDSVRNVLGFDVVTFFEKYNLSPNRVDKLSFDNIFLETDIAQRMSFNCKRSEILHNFTIDIDLC